MKGARAREDLVSREIKGTTKKWVRWRNTTSLKREAQREHADL